ncbi:hypothetical protein PVAG01_07036 [Phlyctema vagabunda]|uniref:Integrase catalytic domain-containing protein n=1 Tax=Phlyctema vagabunda TaxID=108571 RepID=A0ABR4PC22_9HELO
MWFIKRHLGSLIYYYLCLRNSFLSVYSPISGGLDHTRNHRTLRRRQGSLLLHSYRLPPHHLYKNTIQKHDLFDLFAEPVEYQSDTIASNQQDPRQEIQWNDAAVERDPRGAPDNAVGKYIQRRIASYKNKDDIYKDQWISFKEDFIDWDASVFARNTDSSKQLRDFLITRGVYIIKDGSRIAPRLEEILNQREYRQWPEGETKSAELQRIEKRKLDDARELELELSQPSIPSPGGVGRARGLYSIPRDIPPPPPLQVEPTPIPEPVPGQPPLDQPPRQHMSFGPRQAQRTQEEAVYIQNHMATASLPSQYATENKYPVIPNPYAKLDTYTTGSLYAKELAVLEKGYRDELRYTGDGDAFDHKFDIFIERCMRAGIPRTGLSEAVPVILKGEALDYYYYNHSKIKELDIRYICDRIKSNFEGKEYKDRMLQEWNKITLPSIIRANPDKSQKECLEIMIKRLRQIQYSLHSFLRNDEYTRTKLISACAIVPSCAETCKRPSQSLSGLISDLRAATSVVDYIESEQSADIHFTDRKYYGQNRYGAKDSSGAKDSRTTPRSYGNSKPGPSKQLRSGKKYFVCGKPGYWSTNHTKEERENSMGQYLLEYEGSVHNSSESDADADDNIDERSDGAGEVFISTNIGIVNGKEVQTELANQAAIHALIQDIPKQDEQDSTKSVSEVLVNTATTRYGKDRFYGVLVDTGASFVSSTGYNQYLAFNHYFNKAIDTKDQCVLKFGIGTIQSKGTITVDCPIGTVKFHVVEADTPFILSLEDIDRTKYYFNNLTNEMVGEKKFPVIRQFGHAFLLWGLPLSTYCASVFVNIEATTNINEGNPSLSGQLTETELRQIHRRFGHPSVQRLADILNRSEHEFDRQTIEDINRYCTHCQKHGRSPGRFRFNIKDDIYFNYSIVVDITYLGSPAFPVLYIIDEATRFQAARILKDISTKTVWEALQNAWIDTYLGPPDMLVHDAGTQFTAQEFKDRTGTMGITTKCVPVEAYHSIGIVERYHGPLRRAYDIIVAELSPIRKEDALQMAIKAVNDTAGPDGLTPTLLVFGSYPRLSNRDPPHPSVLARGRAIEKAMKEVSQLHAKRQVAEARNQRNGPVTEETLSIPIGSLVWVNREESGWQGPYKLLAIDSYTATVQLPGGIKQFRVTSIKKHYEKDESEAATPPAEPVLAPVPVQEPGALPNQEPVRYRPVTPPPYNHSPYGPGAPIRPVAPIGPVQPVANDMADPLVRRKRGRPRKNPVAQPQILVTAKEQENLELATKLRAEGVIRSAKGPFIESRQKEIDGLLQRGVFSIVSLANIPPKVRLFKSRFVDEVKGKDTVPYEKSRLVVQAHNDIGKAQVLTQSPTIQRASQRLILCLGAILGPEFKLHLRDISQAYIQSTTELNRSFFVKPPREIDIGPGNVLKVLKPLYGVPEAGTHWFNTYHAHHTKELGLQASTYDPCLLYGPQSIVALQTDDTLFVCTDEYVQKEDEALKKAQYMAKPVEQLSAEHSLTFNGGHIQSNKDGSIILSQKRQCERIQTVQLTKDPDETKTQYIRERARGAYIASMSQPEVAFGLSFAAQVTDIKDTDVTFLNKQLSWQKSNQDRGLRYLKLKFPANLVLNVFVDASFAGNKDLSSQIGYLTTLGNESKNEDVIHFYGNIITWSSTKCKRVTRSVLASELYAMVAGFDTSHVIQATVSKILDQLNINPDIPLNICTDSFSLYDCLIKLSTTIEKRLMIDIMGLRQSYERREIREIRWIDGKSNPADALTKDLPCTALKQLIDTNQLDIKTKGWVERDIGR